MNSEFAGGRTNTAKFSLYVSPYLVANQGGRYTKHIYIGSQRIVSKIGDFASYGSDPRRIQYAGSETDGLSVNYKQKYSAQQQVIKNNYAIFEVPYNGTDNNDYVDGQGFCCDDGSPEAAQARALALENNFQDPDAYEKLQFYYHPDHLGSSSYITNLDGEVVQHIEYVPFGEVFIEERNSIWNTPYLFNAKEFDEETGLYYYGARYYDPRLSLWMSVDPQAEKTSAVSPYSYCFNNPIKLIDQDGEIPALALILKAGANAGADWFMQATINYYFNPETAGNWSASVSNVDGLQIVRSGIEGLLPWKVPGGKMGIAALSAFGDITFNYARNLGEYSIPKALQDFAEGFISHLAGDGVGELLSKYGVKAVARGLSQIGFDDKMIEDFITGAGTTWKGKIDYSVIPDSPYVGPGKNFTASQKSKIRRLNMQINNGYLRSDYDGTFLTVPTRGGKSELQAEIDHITPRSKGGSNSTRNAQILSKKQNGQKSNH